MLGLYLDTCLTGYEFGSIKSKLDKLTLQKELQNFMTNNMFVTKKSKNTTTTKQKKQT